MSLDQRIITSTIPPECAGLRLDAWLCGRFTYHSRAQWQKIVRDGKILVNDRPCRNSRALRAGDVVAYKPDFEEPEVDARFETIFEDEHFLAVNKPGFLPCHPAGPFFKNTLWWLLSKQRGETFIVNRLDRETSGIVLAAKSSEAASKLSDLFVSGKVEKKYAALVFGEFPPTASADGWLVPDKGSAVNKKRRFVSEDPGPGADAETCRTAFRRLASGGGLSAVEALPKTGRLHQIRATLFSLGFPLAGDKLYGPDENIYIRFANGGMTAEDERVLLMSRQALHAGGLSFRHPFTGKDFHCEAPPPEDFFALCKKACILWF